MIDVVSKIDVNVNPFLEGELAYRTGERGRGQRSC